MKKISTLLIVLFINLNNYYEDCLHLWIYTKSIGSQSVKTTLKVNL